MDAASGLFLTAPTRTNGKFQWIGCTQTYLIPLYLPLMALGTKFNIIYLIPTSMRLQCSLFRFVQAYSLTVLTTSQGSWTEGPGLLARPDRHAVPSLDNIYTLPGLSFLTNRDQWLL